MRKLNLNYIFVLLFIVNPSIVAGQILEEVAKKAAEATFSEAERQLIKKYYEATEPMRNNDETAGRENNNINKNKGRENRPNLPKGIAKKLERGGTLPPGIAKRPLAGDLERQLPKAPEGFERLESEGQVVLRNVVTGVVSDVIDIMTKPNNATNNQREISSENSTNDLDENEQPGKSWWQFWKK